jgi:tetratricopeptide (TPR) repeat protein
VATILQQCKVARQKMRSGARAEARALCLEILKQQPNNLFAHRLLAMMAIETGSREALEHFQQSALIDPRDPLAEIGQAVFAEQNRAAEGAVKHFRRAAELDPDDEHLQEELQRLGVEVEETALARGTRALAEGNEDAAVTALREALAEAPDDASVKLTLAEALWKQGATEQAVVLAMQVLSTHAQSIDALMLLLAAESRRGRALRIRELQSRADAIDPGFYLHGQLADLLGLPRSK